MIIITTTSATTTPTTVPMLIHICVGGGRAVNAERIKYNRAVYMIEVGSWLLGWQILGLAVFYHELLVYYITTDLSPSK